MNHVEIANEIFKQLGGNQFAMMIGAKKPLIALPANENRLGGLSVGFKARAVNGIKAVRIELTAGDWYRVEFYKGVKFPELVSRHEPVYCDELQSLFEKETGLCAYLFAPVRFA